MWLDDLYELGELLDENNMRDLKRWFILKPSMGDRGQGIRLFESKDAVREIFESFEDRGGNNEYEYELDPTSSTGDYHGNQLDTGIIASQLRHFVIQVRDRHTVFTTQGLIYRLRNTSPRRCYLIQEQRSFRINRLWASHLALAK